MLFGKVDPYHSHRIVGTRRDSRFRVFRFRIPKQVGIVIEFRILDYTYDLPITNGQRIMLAAARTGILGDNLPHIIEDCYR